MVTEIMMGLLLKTYQYIKQSSSCDEKFDPEIVAAIRPMDESLAINVPGEREAE